MTTCARRDRHGRLHGGVPDEVGFGIVEPPQGITDDDVYWWNIGEHNLSAVAKTVFANRNAQGAHKYPDVRRRIKPEMRRHLRHALKSAVNARAEIVRGAERAFDRCLQRAFDSLRSAEQVMRDAERPVLMIGKRRQDQVAKFAIKGNMARAIYSDADRDRWKLLAGSDDLRYIVSKRRRAEIIATREGLPTGSIETIRKVI